MIGKRSLYLGGLVGVALGLFCLSGCGGGSPAANPWGSQPGPKILVSFAPLYSFAANVVGDSGQVKCLLTATGPHSHGESIRDEHIQLARHADCFCINGLGLDEQIAKKLQSAAASKKWKLIEAGEGIDKKLLLEGECHHDVGDAGHKHDHEHGTDPHVWLCPKRAKAIVGVFAEEFQKLDPANAAKYEARAAEYGRKLDGLIAYGKEKLKDKKEKSFISFHDSLQYFAQTFELKIADVIQVDPGIEPTEKKMNEVVAFCLKEKVRLIAVEPQFPARTSAKKILDALKAKGIEAEFVEIDPLETCEPAELTADFYEKKMRQNLDNLAKALR